MENTKYRIIFRRNIWYGHMYWLQYKKYFLWWTVTTDTDRSNLIKFSEQHPNIDGFLLKQKNTTKELTETKYL